MTSTLSFTPPLSIQPKSLAIHTRREALSAQWTQAAQSKGAASVTFVNEIDEEEIPPLKGFCYLEKDYNYDNIEHPGRDEKDFFSYCDHRTCESPDECECPTQGNIGFAYDANGRFVGNVDADLSPFVVECNEYCACDRRKCRNRVAQLPRKVPVEIFKTRKCGWGARASMYVEKGTVLGLYTGKIMRDAEVLKGEAKSFCFDMDGREDPEEDAPEESYTVDAKACGNWTRFLNHSCAPNVKVYSAIWTTIPESNLPCLVYYAAEDIPARKEFTVDYNPSQARLHTGSKGKKRKGKSRIPKGAIPCECGTKACRGWVTEACDY
ncbi:SET domain-containing protein [Marasmius fiardii PR-910]|nr:SET domain-containing protein [Marasmius fiardii PR-910]